MIPHGGDLWPSDRVEWEHLALRCPFEAILVVATADPGRVNKSLGGGAISHIIRALGYRLSLTKPDNVPHGEPKHTVTRNNRLPVHQ